MIENAYEHDLRMDEIEADLGEVLLQLQKILRRVHLVRCPTCAEEAAEAGAPTPPVTH
jgi:hypothetical protein